MLNRRLQRLGRHQKSRGRRGLTLVELSIVLLVMSMLLGIMFGVYGSIANISKTVSPSMEKKRTALAALEMIRSSLNQTFYRSDQDRLVFLGRKGGDGDSRSDRITFAAVHPGAAEVGMPEVREVSYYLDTNEGILYKREDSFVDDNPGEGGNHYAILSDVISFELSYSLKGKSWVEEWNSKLLKKIPLLIRIQVRTKVGNTIERFETLANPGLARD